MKKNYFKAFKIVISIQILIFLIYIFTYNTKLEPFAKGLIVIFTLLIPAAAILLLLTFINKFIIEKYLNIDNNNNINNNKQSNMPIRDVLKSYVIEFPFYGVRGDGEEVEEEYFDGKKAYKWFNDDVIEGINGSWNNNNMMEFIDNDEVSKKINDMHLFVCEDGTCKIIVSVFEELNKEEKDYVLDYVSGQASDGWGEGDFYFDDKDGKPYSVIFWKYKSDWYIKYRDEDLTKMLFDEFKRVTEKDCYEIELIDSKPDIKDNKIGGIPYIPKNEEYPKDKNGKDMVLLLQVNLKDIKLDNFPKEGILEIFIFQDESGVIEKGDYVVKYYKDDLEYQTTTIPRIDIENHYYVVNNSYGISLKKSKSHMSYWDYRFNDTIKKISNDILRNTLNIKVTGAYKLDNIYGDILNNYENADIYNPKICIGGYADFPQGDPREHNVSKDKSECLFKLDSEYDFEKIFLGDGGILYALISPEELKNKKFDETYIDSDCF